MEPRSRTIVRRAASFRESRNVLQNINKIAGSTVELEDKLKS